jgi:hypothetical protein
MDPIVVRECHARWQAVSDVEESERQQATIESRWRKLNAILQVAVTLGPDLRSQSEDEAIVWQRRARLKTGPVFGTPREVPRS